MKKNNIVFMLIALSFTLTACGTVENRVDNKHSVNVYTIDSNVTKKAEIVHSSNKKENTKDDDKDIPPTLGVNADGVDTSTLAGEITFVGYDNSKEYIVEGNDIVYNNRRFVNLYSSMEMLDTNIDKNNFINMIIKTTDVNCKTMYCILECDDEEDEFCVPLHEQMAGDANYDRIVNKYDGDVVTSKLMVIDNTNRFILEFLFGKNYVIRPSATTNYIIDMSIYDNGVVLDDAMTETDENEEGTDTETSEDTEETEENTEETEESGESIEESTTEGDNQQ